MYGGLAVVRCLGRRGIEVSAAGGSKWQPPALSRYLRRRLPGPAARGLEGALGWVEGLGMDGAVLIPSGDTMSWLVAERREQLMRRFRVSPPPGDAMYAVLNKQRLYGLAAEAGLRQPDSWFPESLDDVRAGEFPEAVLIKPRTHIGNLHWRKAWLCTERRRLTATYHEALAARRFDPVVEAYDPDVGKPFVQRYFAASRQTVYNLTGYIAKDPELAVFRATRKVLQIPRRIGIGLCFEAAPVDAGVRERVLTMCRAAGFHGMFEAEFVPDGNDYLLIDFNARYYNSIGFDEARGFPLPWFAYLEAVGDESALADAILEAERTPLEAEPANAWSHGVLWRTMIAGQLASGGMSWSAARRWRRWRADRDVVDAVWAPDDRRPGIVEPLVEAWGALRDPRRFAGRFLRH